MDLSDPSTIMPMMMQMIQQQQQQMQQQMALMEHMQQQMSLLQHPQQPTTAKATAALDSADAADVVSAAEAGTTAAKAEVQAAPEDDSEGRRMPTNTLGDFSAGWCDSYLG